MERQQTGDVIRAPMTIAMHCNRGALLLHFTHLFPEPGMRREFLQPRVLIVGDHRKDGANPESPNKFPDPGPSLIVHGGAQVVNPEQVLGRSWEFLHSRGPFSPFRSPCTHLGRFMNLLRGPATGARRSRRK